MEDQATVYVLILLLCVLLSSFFSAGESAFAALNKARMKSLALGGGSRAAAALKFLDHGDALGSTILIGKNAANLTGASVAAILFARIYGGAGIAVSAVVMTAVVLFFCEAAPKLLAKGNPEGFAMAATPVLRLFLLLFAPLVLLLSNWKKLLSRASRSKNEDRVTQEELMTFVDEAQSEGGIDENNGELIRSAIEFNDLDANDILTPRVNLVAVELRTPMEEITQLFLNSTYSRLPVYEGSIDNIIGMIHEKDYFSALCRKETSIAPMIKKVTYVGTGIKISDLLRLLQQVKTHMAVVVDEFGGTQGIVTMEDILEELVGDIWDEHDEVIDYFKRIDDRTYEVNCGASLDDMFDFFGLEKEENEFDSVTVSGWVMERLGRIPSAGDSFEFRKYRVTVLKAAARRATLISVRLPEPAAAAT